MTLKTNKIFAKSLMASSDLNATEIPALGVMPDLGFIYIPVKRFLRKIAAAVEGHRNRDS